MASGYGIGASLASFGQGQKQEATQVLGNAANEETRRNLHNTQMAAQEEAGNRQLGATMGAMAGMAVGGPVGAMIGGAVGAIAGGLFD